MTLSQWADEYFYLSAESAANPGKWHTLPYQRDILDSITDPAVEEVWVQKSARVGFTKLLDIAIGYHIHQDPCPIMMVQPTIEDAQGTSKEEVEPMLRDVPVLAAIAPKARAKTKDETILHKLFKGPMGRASLSLVGANSPRGFRRVSRRVVLFDEVDGYPPSAGAEGDQIALGKRRAEYYTNRKIVGGSTPTLEGFCRIVEEVKDTDQRRRFLPCPHCGHMQYLQWGEKDTPYGIKWEPGKPETAAYLCEACACLIEHKWLRWMDERGEWRPTATGNPKKRGFIFWAAYSYSPNATWPQLVEEFLASKDNPEKFQTWVNTIKGEPYSIQGEQADYKILGQRLVSGWVCGEVPAGVALLVATVDVQENRLEAQIVGFGAGERTWLIDHEVVQGSPEDFSTWDDLEAWRLKPRLRVGSGEVVPIEIMLVDSNYATDHVVNYVRPRQRLKVFACRGEEKLSKRGMVSKGATRKERLLQYQVATWDAKRLLQHRLTLVGDRPGRIYLPEWISDDYLEQITAEKLVKHRNRKTGRETLSWIKTRDRNEALDLWVYAIAGLRILQEFVGRKKYADLAALLAERTVATEQAKPDPQAKSATPATRPKRVIHTGGGGGGFGGGGW
jgi:phage terminase large subunit GpA-like protein